ncbi:phage major capsid protein [Acetobacterium paludosum]|uniref:Phage major capsid protein n=1 Tax=Acetobacterium paludosum TaxID=52693 RepID=A0A923KTJ9_9FIRM|nr:phage major capsid protein [Acetobacterium paludosum]MBC3889507.1 phage major capsid protein [Acetobacterium paludosum]
MGLDQKQMIEDMNKAFVNFKEANDQLQKEVKEYGMATGEVKGLVETMQKKMDDIEVKMQRVNTSPSIGDGKEQTAETKAMMDYMRKGVVPEVKALSTDSDPDGGYMLPPQMETTIIARIRDFSPVRQVASKSTISTGNALLIPREGNTDFESGWVGERQARPETATGTLEMLRITLHEMYAQPTATQQLIDDPAFNFESYINQRIADLMARKEGYAFINGTGINQPEGLLVSNQVSTITNTLTFDSLIGLQAELRQQFAINANFMMNRFTLAYIRTLKDKNDQYLWQPSSQVDKPNMILGDTYQIADDMPNAASAGVLVTGATPLLYGDFSAYRIVDRQGLRTVRDPYTSKPNVLFYTTKQVGGQVINDQAIKKLKLS